MSIDYRYVERAATDESFRTIIAQMNNPALPSGIIDKAMDEFEKVNKKAVLKGDTIFIPILPPFQKKYDKLLHIDDIILEENDEIPQIEEPSEVTPEESTEDEVAEQPPEHTSGQLNYRLYPYTFSRPNETIEAIVRLYNDMSVSKIMIAKLVAEFTTVNKDALPPHLGQTVQVPVLLPFCYRHENKNKIFTDE